MTGLELLFAFVCSTAEQRIDWWITKLVYAFMAPNRDLKVRTDVPPLWLLSLKVLCSAVCQWEPGDWGSLKASTQLRPKSGTSSSSSYYILCISMLCNWNKHCFAYAEFNISWSSCSMYQMKQTDPKPHTASS